MSIQIALLRGINVGGNRILPMAELGELLGGLGARNVKTYIQSGNAVFYGGLSSEAIADSIEVANGFRPQVLVLSLGDYCDVIAGNPFPEAVEDPKSLHIFFQAAPSSVDTALLEAAKGPEERFVLTERALYLHTPKYLSGSKLAVKLEKLMGVTVTARNWRSATKILDLANSLTLD
ncbi:MAG: hypothetical protein ACI861_000690 [Paracoccaceae bacterium]|jgi:uncharacterized protein (DUF1697 family)